MFTLEIRSGGPVDRPADARDLSELDGASIGVCALGHGDCGLAAAKLRLTPISYVARKPRRPRGRGRRASMAGETRTRTSARRRMPGSATPGQIPAPRSLCRWQATLAALGVRRPPLGVGD